MSAVLRAMKRLTLSGDLIVGDASAASRRLVRRFGRCCRPCRRFNVLRVARADSQAGLVSEFGQRLFSLDLRENIDDQLVSNLSQAPWRDYDHLTFLGISEDPRLVVRA